MKMKKLKGLILTMVLIASLAGCSTAQNSNSSNSTTNETTEIVSTETSTSADNSDNNSTTIISSVEGSILDTSELFTSRDLEQTADLTDAVYIQLESGEDVAIAEEGVYVLSGDVTDVTVLVEAADDAKVQIVLDGVNITNEDSPAIYVKEADKVFITSTDSDNYMEVYGDFVEDGDNNLDSVIFSKTDLVLNGTGSLEIVSTKENGITSKDDLKITGGIYTITSSSNAIEANDSIRIYDGDITIVTDNDGIHSENDDDADLGYIYIQNVTLNINAGDDAIHANSIVQIDGGTINIETSSEGIEGTYIQINGGEIYIYATDDGINATSTSNYDVIIEVNDGTINVVVGSGDTDAFDANGDIYINGGTITVEATSSFDADGTAVLNGGDVTVNGETITEIVQTQMGKGKGK
ncbi:carbohydrate-binding domain-containing protein [Clostridium sp. DL1XJH146]